jgi:cation:H+ antiporter
MNLLPLIALAAGLAALVWSAGRFVEGASGLARHFGMSPLLVGMVVVGLGTSAPEMLVSVTASLNGNPGIALGNAYGSSIAYISLCLGLAALVAPVAVRAMVVRREIPVLIGVTLLTVALAYDLRLSRLDAMLLLGIFAGLLALSVVDARRRVAARPAGRADGPPDEGAPTLAASIAWTALGLAVLVASSQLMVWGAVETAKALGVSDLVIGLTVIAVGTSLPELASTISAVRQRAYDIALGNVIGSNLFNTLAVVGLAGVVRPIEVPRELLVRDLPVMTLLTFALLAVCVGAGVRRRLPGRITRIEGGALIAAFVAYTTLLVVTGGD